MKLSLPTQVGQGMLYLLYVTIDPQQDIITLHIMLRPEPATVVGGTDFCHRIVKVICCALPLLCSNGIRFQELTTRVNSPVLLCSVEW